MKLSIIIPNYNGRNLLEKNLPKVLEVAKGAEIIIVDDASDDDSVQFIKKEYSGVRLIVRVKNEGFSSSVNDGVAAAKGQFVLLLNSDAYPEKGFLDTLLLHFNDPNVFAVGLLQKSIENGKVILRGRGIGGFHRGFLIHANGTFHHPEPFGLAHGGLVSGSPKKTREMLNQVQHDKTTLWVSGGAGVFRKSLWEKLGGMNTLYNPFYWEDIDLSYRAMKAGYTILFEPNSIVVHEQSIGSIRSKYTAHHIKTVAYCNQLFFVWLNITDIRFLMEYILWLPFHLVRSLVTGDTAFLLGYIQAISHLLRVLHERKKISRMQKKTDQEVLDMLQ